MGGFDLKWCSSYYCVGPTQFSMLIGRSEWDPSGTVNVARIVEVKQRLREVEISCQIHLEVLSVVFQM